MKVRNAAGEMRVTKSAIEREPFGESKLILGECTEKRAARLALLRRGRNTSVSINDAKERIVLLGEAAKTDAQIMVATRDRKICRGPFIARIVVIGGDRGSVECCAGRGQIAVVSGAIPVEKRSNGKEHAGI